jgi:hypothetical protein
MTPPTESVAPGSLVELRLIYQSGESETITLSIVPDKLADYRNGFLGEGTPLALAIMGQQPGAKIPYRVGDMAAIEIVSVKPSEGEADQGVARRREATLRKALLRSDLTNAVIFATSFDSKWGDYDPSKLVEELEDQAQDSGPGEEPGQKDP